MILLDYCIDAATELLYFIRVFVQNIIIMKDTIKLFVKKNIVAVRGYYT